ncbi:hypothetical protein BGZ57DRAFT_979791 [Hyaloscypha finlandica]|nr:hypothetical protein BGZ57DRAFT_979791 [Hyaloscypha finlandica]
MALDPAFDMDLDEIYNGENATPHQSFQQDELHPAFIQGDFASTSVFPGEEYQNFLPQDDLASYDLFQPGLKGNTFNQEDFPMTENLLQPQIDGAFQQDQMTFVGKLSQALFYDNIGQQGPHGTGILQSAGHPYMPESLGSDQASNRANFQRSVQQADRTTSLDIIEQPCVDPVGVANQSRGPGKSGRGYSHEVHGFTASANAYRLRFDKWGFPRKNRTKANVGAAIVSDDDKNSIRERAAQALPKQQSQKGGVPWAFVKDLVPKALADKTYKRHGDIISHLEKLVKGLFDKGNKNGWTYNEFTLVPPSGAKDNSKTWQLLTHQCYSTSTLAECGLSSRVALSLQRLFVGLHQAAKICNPNVLIYFWNVCTSLNRIRLSGMPKTQGYPLLRLLLAALEKSFSNSRKSSERTHSMIDFLRSLSSILKEDPRDMRETLAMALKPSETLLATIIQLC